MTDDAAVAIWRTVLGLVTPEFERLRTEAERAGAWPGWELRVLPPLPETWPPNGSGVLVFLAAAARLDLPDLMDAERSGGVWARVRCVCSGDSPTAQLEMLADAITEVGIQGFRPLNAEEFAISESGYAVSAVLASMARGDGPPPEDAGTDSVRAYYRQEMALLGMFGDIVRIEYPAFAVWLAEGGERV